MTLLRIREAVALDDLRLRLTLTDGEVIERDVSSLLKGEAFDEIRSNRDLFAAVRVEGGTVVWPNGADLCPDTLIWGGLPPPDSDPTESPAPTLSPTPPQNA